MKGRGRPLPSGARHRKRRQPTHPHTRFPLPSAFSVAAINRRRLESSRRGFNGQIAKFRAILVLFRTASFHFPLVGCLPVPWEGFALGFGSALLLHRGDGSHPLPTSIQLQLRANCHLGACLLPRFSLWTVIKSLFHNRDAEPCLSRKLTKAVFL